GSEICASCRRTWQAPSIVKSCGLRRMKEPRSRRANRTPGRGWAGEGLAWREGPHRLLFVDSVGRYCKPALFTGPVAQTSYTNDLILLLFDAQQLRCLYPEAAELHVLRLVLVHPPHCPVVEFAGLYLLGKLPVGHRQDEPLPGIAPFRVILQGTRFLQRL